MAELKSIVELTKVKSRTVGHTYSVRANEELQNGFCVKLGDVEVDELEVYSGEKAVEGDTVALIASPVRIPSANTLAEDQEQYFSIEKGDIARGYELVKEDFFKIAKQAVEGDTATLVSNETYLVPDGNKWKITNTNPEKGTVLQYVKTVKREAPRLRLLASTMNLNFVEPELYFVRVVHN